jgi:pimeloyl-ACP methyl ester carboxylesterase
MTVRCYVLVHGAFHGGWCWQAVAEHLRSDGHRVYTPTLTGLGERAHLLTCAPTLETFIEDVTAVILHEDLTDVVLVGHSFGGSVVSGVADQIPERLSRLVYLDALLLRSGESAVDRSPEAIRAHMQRAADEEPLAFAPPPPEHFGITDPAHAEAIAPRLSPQPIQPYFDKLRLANPLGNGIQAVYIACTDPPFASTEQSRALAKSMDGWTYTELATAHNAMTLVPRELALLLAGMP